MDQFESFFAKTSFHGLNYVGDRNTSILKKTFWLSIFLAGVISFSCLAHSTVNDFLSRNTKIQIDETHANLSEVIFPAVVVCNNNQFRRSFAYWIINMLKKDGKLESDPIIKNGSKRTLTEEEQQVFDLIRGDYFEGSAVPKS